MKIQEITVVTDNFKSNHNGERNWLGLIPLLIFSMLIFSTNVTFAHCDTMDGPLIADARKAIGQNNVNYVLKWVPPANEKEIKDAFDLMMNVIELSPDARKLSEKYFFETLVRIHREGEGVPYTGVKPSGTPIDEKILAADKSIEAGNLLPLKGLVTDQDMPELTERFNKVMSLKNFDVNNVGAGREYVEAYVQFFKFAEGETEEHAAHVSQSDVHSGFVSHTNHIPWILTVLFFITTILFGLLNYRKKIVLRLRE